MEKTLGVYVHIPFCRSKCEYCDFYSLGGGRSKELMDRYLHALILHIRETAALAPDYLVDTVYFGGGTPSFFGADGLKRILAEIRKRFNMDRDCEVTFEANPESVNAMTLHKLRSAGFNRMSLGVQNEADEVLKALGRPHTYEQAVFAVENARKAGFENISLDLMYGLPNQTREKWMQTLRTVLDLRPDHLSCYGLKVEPGTPLSTYYESANLPDDDTQADMYLYAVETLENFGYAQYEISNFAREGMACRHNLKYWTGGEYIGFGPSASSDFAGKRFTAAASLDTYLKGVHGGGVILSECETIAPRERAGEYLMLRLRTSQGINGDEYESRFLLPFDILEKGMRFYAEKGLAVCEEGCWHLTPKGFLLSNRIIGGLLELQERSQPLTRRGR
ncbi:radical SAM family heme chaperone HemW [Candidatus Avoscillospira sp. LCP25S3_F1]|uniref:radical SAM family heme chaperone HemW n=1 Tax=Candidatus Avoscillospira sp. LCP25S3_F1 TaxID=3438825 RepID=UPI003F936A96